jgi:DNA topoisomerase-1
MWGNPILPEGRCEGDLTVRLRRSALSGPGIRRVRRGNGFTYYDSDGKRLSDKVTVQRIKDLVIPPAWRKVWISPYRNGHIQAVGTDAAGRRQYLYHQRWQQERAEEKFDRVLEMSAQLPDWRAGVADDLAGRGLTRKRVMALALHMLDRGYFRAGGEEYAEDNASYGLATLLCEHVTLHGGAVAFDYPAKSGVRRTLQIEDPEVVRAVRALLRRGDSAERLLVCRTASGWSDVHADDLNARFKELVGDEYSIKDLRTWHGTVLAAKAFVDADPPLSKRVIKRVEAAVMKEVAEALGNTPAVARGSYVDPRVVAGYEQGLTIAAAVRRADKPGEPATTQAVLEKATRTLINRVAKGSPQSRRPTGSGLATAA